LKLEDAQKTKIEYSTLIITEMPRLFFPEVMRDAPTVQIIVNSFLAWKGGDLFFWKSSGMVGDAKYRLQCSWYSC